MTKHFIFKPHIPKQEEWYNSGTARFFFCISLINPSSPPPGGTPAPSQKKDRQGVGEGKGVDLGGRRTIQKKNK